MTEQTPEDRPQADLGEQDSAPAPPAATDIDADDLDVEAGAGGDRPATNDPDEYVDDSTLGGTGGGSAGGAG